MYTQREKTIYVDQLNGLERTQPAAVRIAREIIEAEEFNGWINRETCVIALHLSSDQELYTQALAMIDGARNTNEAAVFIERWVKEKHGILHHEPHNRIPHNWAILLADAGSLWRVDWQAIALSLIHI